MKTALVAQLAFHAWGKDYNKGQEIPTEEYAAWDKRATGTLARRLQSGDVKYDVIDEAAETPKAPVLPTGNVPKFTDKETAKKWAMDAYKLDLDGRLSLETMVEKINEAAAAAAK